MTRWRPEVACLAAALLLTVLDPVAAVGHAARHAIADAAQRLPLVAGHVE